MHLRHKDVQAAAHTIECFNMDKAPCAPILKRTHAHTTCTHSLAVCGSQASILVCMESCQPPLVNNDASDQTGQNWGRPLT